jgi:phenylalanyl-tRNA synthetase beta chain
MKISYNWLQTYFAKQLPSPEKLEELFIFHACEVEGAEKIKTWDKTNDGKSHEIEDTILDLKVLPDRAHYALCHKGIADEVFSLTQIPRVTKPVVQIKEATDKKPSIKIEAKGFCRRYVGRYVEVAPAPVSSSARFHLAVCGLLDAIGQRSINPIVDATNYVMFDIGQPLHAFDADKVKGNIVVRAAQKGEKIALLESSEGLVREIELTEQDHVIADDEGPLAIAGVKGGKRAAISSDTKRLILESANFEPRAVRRTSTKYDLRSESSKRYENEITPELALDGMNELSALILRVIPDAKFGPIVDVYPTKAAQTFIEIDPKYISERLGIEVPVETSMSILENMGILVENPHYMYPQRTVSASAEAAPRSPSPSLSPKVVSDAYSEDSYWKLTIPFNRLDLSIPDDVVEEVGRIYGYEHIKGVLPPNHEGKIRVLPIYYLSEKIKNILVTQGYSEVSLYSLVAEGEIEAAKPLARDKAFARPTLALGMISCVEKNVLNADLIGLDSIKIFEIGHVFSNAGESIHLSIGAAQVKKIKGVNGKKIIGDVIEILGKELGITAELKVVSSKLQEKGNIAVCEIDLNELLRIYKLPSNASYDDLGFGPASTNLYKKISQYPFIVRDIAVFVPDSVLADEVWGAIESGIKNTAANSLELLVRHALFDTFKKDGKVSYAFRMVFQSMDRTLTDDEAGKIMTTINVELKQKGWEVR